MASHRSKYKYPPQLPWVKLTRDPRSLITSFVVKLRNDVGFGFWLCLGPYPCSDSTRGPEPLFECCGWLDLRIRFRDIRWFRSSITRWLKEIPCSKCKFCIRIQWPVGSGHFKLIHDVCLDAVQASATMPQLHCKTILPLAFKQFLVLALPKHDIKFSCNFCKYNPHLVKSQPLPNTAMHTIAKGIEFLPAEVVQ